MPKELTEQQRIARNKSNIMSKAKNQKRIPLDLKISDYEKLKNHVDTLNIPLNTYIKEAIFSRYEKETGKPFKD